MWKKEECSWLRGDFAVEVGVGRAQVWDWGCRLAAGEAPAGLAAARRPSPDAQSSQQEEGAWQLQPHTNPPIDLHHT